MKLSDLVVSRGRSTPAARKTRAAEAAEANGEPVEDSGAKSGAFVTPQSLVTFPGAAAAVMGLKAVLEPVLNDKIPYLPLFLALFVGLIIFLITVSEEATRPRNLSGWIVTICIAVINSVLLAGAAQGLPLVAVK